MNNIKKVCVGLIGCGTIGSGVIKLIKEGIARKYGVDIFLKKAADISKKIEKEPGVSYTTDAEEVLNDPEIEIVIELIGGYQPAYRFIMEALDKGKHIVTANKSAVSRYALSIFKKAEQKKVCVGFEASVCGSIPVINLLQSSMPNQIKSIIGILNGSSNYILTQMKQKDYREALKEAQDKGFAERDPSFDVEGLDAAQKISILSLISNGIYVKPDKIYTEGITAITKEDLNYADELGFTIKLLAVANFSKVNEIRVSPVFVPKEHILSSVEYENNAVYVVGKNTGPQLYMGKGAGKIPTAHAVVSDIINIVKERNAPNPKVINKNNTVKNHKDVELEYYFRFTTLDKPGVLAQISAILGSYNISVVSVIQKGKARYVPIVMMTHKALEGNVFKALRKIEKLDCIKGRGQLIRVLDK